MSRLEFLVCWWSDMVSERVYCFRRNVTTYTRAKVHKYIRLRRSGSISSMCDKQTRREGKRLLLVVLKALYLPLRTLRLWVYVYITMMLLEELFYNCANDLEDCRSNAQGNRLESTSAWVSLGNFIRLPPLKGANTGIPVSFIGASFRPLVCSSDMGSLDGATIWLGATACPRFLPTLLPFGSSESCSCSISDHTVSELLVSCWLHRVTCDRAICWAKLACLWIRDVRSSSILLLSVATRAGVRWLHCPSKRTWTGCWSALFARVVGGLHVTLDTFMMMMEDMREEWACANMKVNGMRAIVVVAWGEWLAAAS